MAITKEQFNAIKENSGKWASWAIWDKNDRDSTKIFEDDNILNKLNNKYVIIGLNVSKLLKNDWENFRVGQNDTKLQIAFTDSEYEGCYITDLFKIEMGQASKLMRFLKENGDKINDHVNSFKEEMKLLCISDKTKFIIMGKDAQESYEKYFMESFPKNPTVFITHPAAHVPKGETTKFWVHTTRKALNIKPELTEVVIDWNQNYQPPKSIKKK